MKRTVRETERRGREDRRREGENARKLREF